MKKLPFLLLLVIFISSCNKEEESIYTNNEVVYTLFQASDFDYSGSATVKELRTGSLELTIELNGPSDNEPYFFPAHLHFGSVDSADAPMAAMLEPVSIQTLKSTTILSRLSDGSDLDFEGLQNFDGHIKVHLADSGPDYQVILVAGNVGMNKDIPVSIEKNNLTVCSPYGL